MTDPGPAGPSKQVPPLPSASTVSSLLPSSHAGQRKRADLISLKQRLAHVLSSDPDIGPAYWSGLTDFILGKITRAELGDVLEKCFEPLESDSDRIQALNLHNALLLSILYNTTRPTLPSSSIRHAGFTPRGTQKRKLLSHLVGSRDGNEDEDSELQSFRRKKIKDVVLRVGKRERGEIKAHANSAVVAAGDGGGKFDDRSTMTGGAGRESIGDALRASRGGQGQVGEGGVPKGYKDHLDDKGIAMPANFTQEYNRLVQAPLCCEARGLPDADTLKDRMTLIAYEEGMTDGVEETAVADLLSNAIDYYVKNIVSAAAALVRGPPTCPDLVSPRRPSSSRPASTFAPAGGAMNQAPSPLPDVHSPGTPPPTQSAQRRRGRPLAISDFHALFAVQPALLGPNGSTHTSAVERMYALPPQSDSEDDSGDEYESDRVQAGTTADVNAGKDMTGDTKMSSLDDHSAGVASVPVIVSGKMPRLSTASRNRNLSFYGAARTIPPPPPVPAHSTPSASSSTSSLSTLAPHHAPARTKFLLDPTSLHGVPEGHPDVPHVSSTTALVPLVVAAPNSGSAASDLFAAHQTNSPATNATTTTAGGGSGGGGGTGGGNSQATPALSPKSLSLRNSLFPELAINNNNNNNGNPSVSSLGGSSSAAAGSGAINSKSAKKNAARKNRTNGDEDEDEDDDHKHNNGNGTTTDEADSEFDDLTDKLAKAAAAPGGQSGPGMVKPPGGGGLKIKLGGTTTGTVTPTAGVATAAAATTPGGPKSAGGGGGGVAGDKDKEMGRKLWEVVDSVRLLDGVLDP